MAIDSKIVTTTMKEVMAAVVDAQAAGITFQKPGSLTFKFPIDTSGATVEFDVNMDWYGITPAKEDELWAKRAP